MKDLTFADKIYDHIQTNNLLAEERKGGMRQSRGTKDQLLIDREVLSEAKRKKRFLSMVWIDYWEAYDIITSFLDLRDTWIN